MLHKWPKKYNIFNLFVEFFLVFHPKIFGEISICGRRVTFIDRIAIGGSTIFVQIIFQEIGVAVVIVSISYGIWWWNLHFHKTSQRRAVTDRNIPQINFLSLILYSYDRKVSKEYRKLPEIHIWLYGYLLLIYAKRKHLIIQALKWIIENGFISADSTFFVPYFIRLKTTTQNTRLWKGRHVNYVFSVFSKP